MLLQKAMGCRGSISGEPHGGFMAGLTKRKRLASGLDLVYSITFPLGIHSEIMRKYWGFVDTETPSRGKMFG